MNEDTDEIAKIYATLDMEEEDFNIALKKADEFYGDISTLPIPNAINAIMTLINNGDITIEQTNTMLDNMIKLYEKVEAYEKCSTCQKIKKGIC